MALIGIDLGTTNSVAAVESQHGDKRAQRPESVPSVVAFLPNGTVRVGEVARRRRSIDSANTIFSSKRIIGRRYDCSETRNFIVRYPFEIVDQGGWPAFKTRAGELTPTRIAATILEALIEQVQVDPSVSEVVITYPVNFSEDQLEATQQAADWAGLGHARFIDEPSATAAAYMHADHPFQRALVYDLGGGTFDCAVVDGSNGAPRVIAHASDLCLGGDDIDHQLAAWAARHVLEKYNWDLTNYSEIYDRLLAACEDAKIELSTSDSVELHLSQIDPECTAVEESVTINRPILEQLCQDIVRRSFIACDSVLRQADLKPPDIDSVFLAGGTTHLPVIQQGIEAYFGHAGHMEHEPTEVVALGARLNSGAIHS